MHNTIEALRTAAYVRNKIKLNAAKISWKQYAQYANTKKWKSKTSQLLTWCDCRLIAKIVVMTIKVKLVPNPSEL